MKILWLSHVVPFPPKRGVLLRAYNLIKEVSHYHDIDLVAINQQSLIVPYFGDYRKGSEIAKEELSKYCKNMAFVDCPSDEYRYKKNIVALKSLLPWMPPYSIGWLQSGEYQSKVTEMLSNNDYDLVHCDTISLVPYLKGEGGFIKTLDHHNVESEMLLRRASLSRNYAKKLYFYQEGVRLEQYERKYCSTFDSNIMCSDLDSQRLSYIDSTVNTFVAPNSVDTNFFQPSNCAVEPATFLVVGTLSWYPNLSAIRYLIEHLWQEMKMLHPEMKMHVIGANPAKDLIEFSNSEENFHIHGFVDDLTPFFEAATGYLCPISDGGGTKLKLLDAFASGKAVIAHKVACEGLMTTDGDNVLQATNKAEYLEHISTVIGSEEVRKTLEKSARLHAITNFSSKAIGESLANHFSSLEGR